MPKTNINDLNILFEDLHDDLWLALVYYKICSYAFFPNNEEQRTDYMRHVFGRMMIYLHLRQDNDNKYNNLVQYRQLLGGELAIIEASNTTNMQNKLKPIFTSGMIIGMATSAMYCFSKTDSYKSLATKNKMAYFAEMYDHCSRSKFYNLLEEFKSVAHIWAGIYVESVMPNSPNAKYDHKDFTINDIKLMTNCLLEAEDCESFWESRQGQMITTTLAWSVEFQKFTTTYNSPRSPKILLTASEIWKVPEIIEYDLPALPSIDPKITKSLTKYKVHPSSTKQ